MAEWDRTSPERYEETVEPRNPPNSLLKPAVQKTTLLVYLGPLLALLIIVGIALAYWVNRERDRQEHGAVPTTGISQEVTPGGHDPDPHPGSTQEELKYRGTP
jgi:hypothetical protein